METIEKKLKAICKEKGVKQDVIAKELGITQGTLSGKLKKGDDIKYSLLLEIANIAKIPIIDIITYPEIYVPKQKQCEKCEEKDEIIRHLTNYIKTLEKKK